MAASVGDLGRVGEDREAELLRREWNLPSLGRVKFGPFAETWIAEHRRRRTGYAGRS